MKNATLKSEMYNSINETIFDDKYKKLNNNELLEVLEDIKDSIKTNLNK